MSSTATSVAKDLKVYEVMHAKGAAVRDAVAEAAHARRAGGIVDALGHKCDHDARERAAHQHADRPVRARERDHNRTGNNKEVRRPCTLAEEELVVLGPRQGVLVLAQGMAGRVAVRPVRVAEQQLAVGELDLEALPLARAVNS